jgi:acyl-CoA synthetase (AMP-forming)/AMP-acid ligase II
MPAAIYLSASHQESLDNISKPESVPRTIDALLRLRAISYPQEHIVSYPKSGIDFVDYNLQQLDVFAWRAANHYEQLIPARKSSKEKPHVVALLGVSNFEYLITLLALIKLGHTVLLLSTRITVPAIESLINATSATTIIVDRKHLSTAKEIQNLLPSLQLFDMISRPVFEFPIEAHGDTQLDSHLDPEIEAQNIALIIHSSGKMTETLNSADKEELTAM